MLVVMPTAEDYCQLQRASFKCFLYVLRSQRAKTSSNVKDQNKLMKHSKRRLQLYLHRHTHSHTDAVIVFCPPL